MQPIMQFIIQPIMHFRIHPIIQPIMQHYKPKTQLDGVLVTPNLLHHHIYPSINFCRVFFKNCEAYFKWEWGGGVAYCSTRIVYVAHLKTIYEFETKAIAIRPCFLKEPSSLTVKKRFSFERNQLANSQVFR